MVCVPLAIPRHRSGAGISRATFTQWLDVITDFRFSTAAKLAAYLGMELRPAAKPSKKRK